MTPPSKRLAWLDWMRGIAAAIMLTGHCFHSFLRNDLRNTGPYMASQFVGGMPPAIFMFVLGITFAFLMDSQERKGVPLKGRFLAALKRSGYLFAIAFLFRLQMWIFSGGAAPWSDLLRVDVLNTMGSGLLLLAVMAVFRTVDRIRLCAILGLAIAGLSPLVSSLDWNAVPPIIKHYLAPDSAYFGFFPWGSFIAFGMSAGSLLRVVPKEQVGTLMQWMGWGGVGLTFSSWVFSNIPFSIYPNSEFWLNSPGLILIKLGVMMMVMAVAWVWNLGIETKWSWIRQFGLTSLLVYWVHVELVYGHWFWKLKENLTIPQTVLAAFLVTISMLALSVLRTNWSVVTAGFRSARSARREPISGD